MIFDKNRAIAIAKKVVILFAVIVWAVVFYIILKSGGEFNRQAPTCILATMIIFAIFTAIYKGLEILEKRR